MNHLKTLAIAGMIASAPLLPGCGEPSPTEPVGKSYRLEFWPQGVAYTTYPEAGTIFSRSNPRYPPFDYYLHGTIMSLDDKMDIKNPRYMARLYNGASAVLLDQPFRTDTATIGYPVDTNDIGQGLRVQHSLKPREQAHFLVRAPITWGNQDTVYYEGDVAWDQTYVWVNDRDSTDIKPYLPKRSGGQKVPMLRIIGGEHPRVEQTSLDRSTRTIETENH